MFKRLIWIGHDRKLPTEIYTSLVASLFSDPRTLLVGGLGGVCAAIISAWKTGEPTLIICAIGMVVVTVTRAFDMQAFAREQRERREAMSCAEAMRWEMR